MKQLHNNAAAPADSAATPADTDETSSQAQILRRLLKTRAMLQESRNRSAELQGALERFKYQQAKIVGR
jgi:hypothetical protein